jgi:D-serine deaminase-like pyridoxal phosphate-dependent protein
MLRADLRSRRMIGQVLVREPMRLDEIETPALVLDAARMDRNIARVRATVDRLGVRFRPHVKTAKCIEAVRRMVGGPAGPVTVSTLKEAEECLAHGITDILYAVGVSPGKLPHVLDLRRRGADLAVLLDHVEAARAVADFSRRHGDRLPACIEIDSDQHRAGVEAGSPVLLEIGRALHEGGAELRGVLSHAGGSYDCRSIEAIRAVAEAERRETTRAAERLRAAALPCPVVSIGSTPTVIHLDQAAGVTEVRAGVFVFFDLVMAGLAVCRTDEIALSVLASVIGQQRDKGWLITDAGWMAMSRDRGTAGHAVDQGYGLVCDEAGRPLGDLIVRETNQEHGIVGHRSGVPSLTPMLPIGTRLRILPNHACATAAQHDVYRVVRGEGLEVEETWRRFERW